MEKDKRCIHCYVTGRVQGVWFRASTQEQAAKLDVPGWVRNLPDGRVEVMACGTLDQLTALFMWLQQGPRLAQVTQVSQEELAWQPYHGFQVR
jgi:acylphosphatase